MGAFQIVVILISALLIELGGGKDLYWKPNSNWGNPDNWALGRVPSCGDKASLTTVPANSVVYLDTDATLSSIALPANGRLILGPSVTIKLSPEAECTVSGDTPPMAVTVNEFVGAATNYWECFDNWRTTDNSPVEHAPCGDDTAIFDKGFFSFVGANSSVYVSSMVVRGTDIKSMEQLNSTEFNLKLEVNPKCGDNPSLCPCPDDSLCPKKPIPRTTTKSIDVKPGSQTGGNKGIGGVVAGVVIAIVFIAVVALSVVVIVVMCICKRSSTPYMKEELLDEPGTAPEGKGVYDNPLFSDDVKVDLGAEEDISTDPVMSGGNVYEANPSLENGKEKKEKSPKLMKYQQF